MDDVFSTEGERYRIAIGKFGTYFVDEDTGSEMTLEDVTRALNDSAACVNALAGIDDPEALMRVVRAASKAHMAFRQGRGDRRPMLDALEFVDEHLKGGA